MIPKEEMERFGPTDLISWMREQLNAMEKQFQNLYEKNVSVFHIETTDLDSFKKSVEEYAKIHPDAKIKASGFLISTGENPKKESYKYKPKKKK